MTTEEAGGYLDDLLSLESGLTEWELSFAESLYQQRKACADRRWFPPPKQCEKLKNIWDERYDK